MFGSIGGAEVILLFIVALLLFGPRRLPEIGRTLGKAMSDFRRATNEFKTSLEREVQLDALKETTRSIEVAARPDTLARGMIRDLVEGQPGSPSAPEPSKPPADAPPNDGGSDTVH